MIAKQLNKELGLDLIIYNDYNAIQIKGVIGQCKIIVSSRYHGLVSSLSQGVPCLGTSWSHKYECLFKDYDFSEGLLESNESERIKQKLDYILNNHFEIKDRLLLKSDKLKMQSRKMWDKFYSLIK